MAKVAPTRIRYVKMNEDGLLKSMRLFSNGVQTVYVELNTKAMSYAVKDAETHELVSAGGKTVNLNVLKTQAKKALEDLRIIFSDESRKKNVQS